MKIRSTITFSSIDIDQGEIQVNVELVINTCSFRDGLIKVEEDNSEVEYRGVAEIIVDYLQTDGVKTSSVPASNQIDNRIVVPLQKLQEYVLGLDQTPFEGLFGYERLEAQCYYYLLPYTVSIGLLGTNDVTQWSIVN